MITVRALTEADWPLVEHIYRQGIEDGEATFETDPPSWEQFDESKVQAPRLVAHDEAGTLLGWAAASLVSRREVYRGVVEHSIYVSREARGQGIGRVLLQALIDGAEDAGYWTIQSAIFPENVASIRLHESLDFRTVGRRERIARSARGPHAGTWRDTVLMERRSARNGVEEDREGEPTR